MSIFSRLIGAAKTVEADISAAAHLPANRANLATLWPDIQKFIADLKTLLADGQAIIDKLEGKAAQPQNDTQTTGGR